MFYVSLSWIDKMSNHDISTKFYIQDIFNIMGDQVMGFAKTVTP